MEVDSANWLSEQLKTGLSSYSLKQYLKWLDLKNAADAEKNAMEKAKLNVPTQYREEE